MDHLHDRRSGVNELTFQCCESDDVDRLCACVCRRSMIAAWDFLSLFANFLLTLLLPHPDAACASPCPPRSHSLFSRTLSAGTSVQRTFAQHTFLLRSAGTSVNGKVHTAYRTSSTVSRPSESFIHFRKFSLHFKLMRCGF